MLPCVECDAVADDDAASWRAYLAYDLREDEAPFVALYCPACAAREFDDAPSRERGT